MNKLYAGVTTLIILLSFVNTEAQNVIRGPYMQSPGPYSIIFRWRTDSATDSRVNFGLSYGAQTNTVDSLNLTTEHRVKISGLQPKTKYYYSIGSTTQILRSDSLLYFTTAPDSTTPGPTRFWCIGDWGHGNTAERDVRNSYLQHYKQNPADLQLWLGDNAYQDGTDEEFQNNVFDTVNAYGNVFLNLPFASTSGNHDYNSICPWQPLLCTQDPNQHTGPYLDIIDPPTHGELGGVPSTTKLFYSFDYGDVHFVVLNSELGSLTAAYNWIGILDNSQTFTSPMLDWLKADLQATTKKWKVAIWHQCPYSGQNDFTDDGVQQFCVATRTHFNPIIEQYGIDMVLTGHDHNFQRSYLINGHYGGKSTFTPSMMINGSSGRDDAGEPYIKYTNGPLAGKGAVYVLAGNSSEGNAYSPISHPAIYWGEACDTCYGSFIFDVSGDRLDGYYLSSRDTIMDQFTILKQEWNGIQESPLSANKIHVYPNPSFGQLSIDYSLLQTARVTIDILDLNGRLVNNIFSGSRNPGSYSNQVDLNQIGLSQGTYLVKVNCGGEPFYQRFVCLTKQKQ